MLGWTTMFPFEIGSSSIFIHFRGTTNTWKGLRLILRPTLKNLVLRLCLHRPASNIFWRKCPTVLRRKLNEMSPCAYSWLWFWKLGTYVDGHKYKVMCVCVCKECPCVHVYSINKCVDIDIYIYIPRFILKKMAFKVERKATCILNNNSKASKSVFFSAISDHEVLESSSESWWSTFDRPFSLDWHQNTSLKKIFIEFLRHTYPLVN